MVALLLLRNEPILALDIPLTDHPMTPETYQQTKTALLALGGQRVWSLMVTIFGDLAQPEGSTIDGPVLSAIMAEIDVRPEAVRVALHRLRNDGWIESQKQGRTRRHSLTLTSRKETLQASARIYASPSDRETNWKLVLLEDSSSPTRDEMALRGFTPVLPRVYLGGPHAIPPVSALAVNGNAAPSWLRQQMAPQMLEDEYNALIPVLQNLERALFHSRPNHLQTAVLRCLIVHNWRRIVLRHPALPLALLPENWVGHRCHVLVERLLIELPRPRLTHILPN